MNYLNPTVLTFVLYIIVMVGIGLYAYRATTNFSDYILGGRSLGSVVTALSAGASDMSGWLLMGLPGAIFISGLSEAWIAIGLIVGAWLNWLIVAGRLRVHTEVQYNALTLPDYFTHRFGDTKKILRVVAALTILIFFAVYCASGIVAGAHLFETLFAMDYHTAIWVSAIATIAYVCIGGFLAISWTDTFQAGLMLFALFLAPIFTLIAISNVDGATFTQLIETARPVAENKPGAFDMITNVSLVAIISSLAWGLGYFGQPHIVVRFMAIDSVKSIPAARRIGIAWMTLCLAGAVAVGFFGIAYFQAYPALAGAVNANSEVVFIELAKILFNPWIAGVILAAILAAVMSTLSCQLLVCSTTLTEDLYKAFFRPNASEKELIWTGRLMVVLIAILAIVIALMDKDEKVLGLVAYAWAGFGAAFGPLILLSLLWKRMTLAGAVSGIVVGTITVILWRNFLKESTGIYEIIPGFIFATLSIVVVSLLGKAPHQALVDRFDEADQLYKRLSSEK